MSTKKSVKMVQSLKASSVEECPICLKDFTTQEIGIPENCGHSFCFICLFDWATKNNTCPTDRQSFEYILKKESYFSEKPYAKVSAKDGKLEALIDGHINTCNACGDGEEEYVLLSCSQCNNSYHPFCLNSSNTEAWICPSCGHTHGRKLKLHRTSTKILSTTSGIKQQKGITKDRIIKPCCSSKYSTSQSIITHNKNCARSAVLLRQKRFMTELKRHRKRLNNLPPKVSVAQLPRMKRRVDAPSRPKVVIPKSTRLANVSFLDKLLHEQNNLHTLKNVQMQGAKIQFS
ncbi:hypothetical protein I4U23_025540 [Adineta vaga]|nr:hypothetical protein I4U23_025540 [Adineta vaga]